MTAVPFIKGENCGNDYVLVDVGLGPDAVPETILGDPGIWSREVSHRHTGIGADGLILVSAREGEDARSGDSATAVRMRMWNNDGSRGKLCLNGLSQVALFAHGVTGQTEFTVDTDSGPRGVLVSRGEAGIEIEIAAGAADFRRSALPAEGETDEIWGEPFSAGVGDLPGFAVSVGNPHLVLWADDPDHVTSAPLAGFGPAIQESGRFPDGVNVHLAAAIDSGHIVMRPWERGSGATLACGSGAVAVFAVARRLGQVGESAEVAQPGGSVRLREPADGMRFLAQPALPFTGVWSRS